MQFLHNPDIDFVKWRRIPIVLSLIIMFGGLVTIVFKGFHYSIEFTGGTLVQVAFAKGQTVDMAKMRSALTEAGLAPEIQTISSGGKVSYSLREKGDEKAMEAVSNKTMDVLTKAFPEASPVLEKKDMVGPVVGKDLKRKTYWAIFLSLMGIVIYLAFRFSNPLWGFTGVVELFHDVIGVAAFFCIMGTEIDLLIVTALLTIAGYSVHDTIIIFDRIRENLRIKRGANFGEIVNASINETLSRTIITVLTVQTVCIILLIFGGPVMRNFSLAMVLGNILGTYSSIAATATLIYEWETHWGGKKAAEPAAPLKGGKPQPKKQKGYA
ncbi:MAG: protein translocase subunit SecF [Elusimicrobia bacterium]|nr:protein translocase subunit SecF [Elusimicrobiota bacterium]